MIFDKWIRIIEKLKINTATIIDYYRNMNKILIFTF
jgi:hypothetical protein